MRAHHLGFAGLLLLALVAFNPVKAGAVPGAYSGSVYGVQSDVVQVHRRYKRHRRYYPRYSRRYYYYRPYGYYYRPYRYRPYGYRRYYRGYPYGYGRPGISLYFRF